MIADYRLIIIAPVQRFPSGEGQRVWNASRNSLINQRSGAFALSAPAITIYQISLSFEASGGAVSDAGQVTKPLDYMMSQQYAGDLQWYARHNGPSRFSQMGSRTWIARFPSRAPPTD